MRGDDDRIAAWLARNAPTKCPTAVVGPSSVGLSVEDCRLLEAHHEKLDALAAAKFKNRRRPLNFRRTG